MGGNYDHLYPNWILPLDKLTGLCYNRCMDKKIVWYKEHEKVIVKVMSTPRMHKLDAIEKSGIPLDDISSILSVCIEEKSWT